MDCQGVVLWGVIPLNFSFLGEEIETQRGWIFYSSFHSRFLADLKQENVFVLSLHIAAQKATFLRTCLKQCHIKGSWFLRRTYMILCLRACMCPHVHAYVLNVSNEHALRTDTPWPVSDPQQGMSSPCLLVDQYNLENTFHIFSDCEFDSDLPFYLRDDKN